MPTDGHGHVICICDMGEWQELVVSWQHDSHTAFCHTKVNAYSCDYSVMH